MASPESIARKYDFETPLIFLKRNELYLSEKPYAFKFPLEESTIPSSNIEHARGHRANVADIRENQCAFDLGKNGFAVFDVGDVIDYDDFHDEIKVQKYFRKVEGVLKDHLGAKSVRVFRHALRKRHPQWPKNTGEVYSFDQPTTTVHIDTTPHEVLQEVRNHHGEHFEELTKGRVQWINFWKPLKGPLNDWPLLLCDVATVDKAKDLEPADLLYPDRIAENCLVYHSEKYKWYYLSSHKTNEILVFVQGDTLGNAPSGVPHCSVPNPLSKDELPRESIEARCLVFYGP